MCPYSFKRAKMYIQSKRVTGVHGHCNFNWETRRLPVPLYHSITKHCHIHFWIDTLPIF